MWLDGFEGRGEINKKQPGMSLIVFQVFQYIIQ